MSVAPQFSTASMAPGERLAAWNDASVGAFVPMVVDSDNPDTFLGELAVLPMSRSNLSWVSSAPVTVRKAHRPEVVHSPWCGLMVQHSGAPVGVTHDGDSVLRPGDFMLMDQSRSWMTTYDEPMQCLTVQLYPDDLVAHGIDPERIRGVAMRGDHGAAGMLSDFVRSTWTNLSGEWDEAWQSFTLKTLWRLIERAYAPPAQAEAAASRTLFMRRKAKAYVEERLCDPGLDVGAVAAAVGVSIRRLQMLFAEEAVTPSGYILSRRLELAADRLRGNGSAAITEVAYSVGFSDLSHFCRTFRRRFGVTPSQGRAEAELLGD